MYSRFFPTFFNSSNSSSFKFDSIKSSLMDRNQIFQKDPLVLFINRRLRCDSHSLYGVLVLGLILENTSAKGACVYCNSLLRRQNSFFSSSSSLRWHCISLLFEKPIPLQAQIINTHPINFLTNTISNS